MISNLKKQDRTYNFGEFSELFSQIWRFTIVGFICFGIDYGLLILLTEVFGVNYLISNLIGFSVSVIVNYYLSVRYVFKSGRGQIFGFIILSVAGMGLNELIMYASPLNYMITKIFATAVVMVFNFITRKWLLER